MMNSELNYREQAFEQIDQADIPPTLFRAATRLLFAADEHNGMIKATKAVIMDRCRVRSWGAARRMLGELATVDIIRYNSDGDVVYIDFIAWPVRADLVAPARGFGSLADDNDDDDENDRAKDERHRADLVAPAREFGSRVQDDGDERAKLARHRADLVAPARGFGSFGAPVKEGRKEGRNIDLITTDLEVLPTGIAQSERQTANGEQPTAKSQPQPPPSSEPPPPDGLTADQQRTYALLVELGLSAENALKMAKFHSFAFVVKQVATWYGGEYGIGALYNRLLKPKQFPPGVPKIAFLVSALYKRHYPLDRDEAKRRERVAGCGDFPVLGMETSQAWAASLDPDLVRLLDALPVPIWEEDPPC